MVRLRRYDSCEVGPQWHGTNSFHLYDCCLVKCGSDYPIFKANFYLNVLRKKCHSSDYTHFTLRVSPGSVCLHLLLGGAAFKVDAVRKVCLSQCSKPNSRF